MPDPSRWLNKTFEGWNNLTTQEKKAIRDFPILWSIFELRATGQNGARPNATPARICAAVTNLDAGLCQIVLAQSRDHFSVRYFEGGKPTKAWRQLNIDQDFQGRVRSALLNADADRRCILLGMLLIINRLRNNFLHGEKARYAFANQHENFRQANSVLMSAIPLWDNPTT